MIVVKTTKYAYLAGAIATLMCIYSLVHGQGRQISATSFAYVE